MYRAKVITCDTIPNSDIYLNMEIGFSWFNSKEEAEQEANSVEKVIFQKNWLSLKIMTPNKKYVVTDNNIIFKKLKEESKDKTLISDDDFEEFEDFTLETLKEYLPDGYSFEIVAYKVSPRIVIIDEYSHCISLKEVKNENDNQ